MNPTWCRATERGVRLVLQIQPNARKNEVIGCHGDQLKIRLQAQPVEGKANQALIAYLADVLDLPKKAVIITHGISAKNKIVEINAPHLTVDSVQQTLLAPDAR